MAQIPTSEAIGTQLWPQGDVRDPLGVWGSRVLVTGDATGGTIKNRIQASQAQSAAYVYTVYALQISLTIGIADAIPVKSRILTNWPNIDVQPGLFAFGSNFQTVLQASGIFTAPTSGPVVAMVQPNDRFLLCFLPGNATGPLVIAELEIAENVLDDEYAFEAYGYYWDRSVMQAPGGLRHPGSS